MSLSMRARTDSLATIWLTVTCLPTSRRKSSSADRRVQSALSTSVRLVRAGREVEQPLELHLDALRRCARASSRSSRLRSSTRPPGSPIMPVAPPASAIGRWPASWKRRSIELAEQVADVEAVGGGVEADVDADRTVGEALAERVAVGGVVDEAAGVEVGEQVHRFPCWQKGQPRLDRFGSPATYHRHGWSTATVMPMRVDAEGASGGGVPSSPIHGAVFAATVRSTPSYAPVDAERLAQLRRAAAQSRCRADPAACRRASRRPRRSARARAAAPRCPRPRGRRPRWRTSACRR